MPATVLAQGWSFDAREIALGGVGTTTNLSSGMIDEARPYRTIVIPIGLVQVLSDLDVFNPDSDKFDPVRAVEYAANPFVYIVNRNDTNTGERFISDIRNGRLNRDLNVYRGFVPANNLLAEGLSAPNWGGTIKFQKHADGTYQGVYVGAGPYLSMRTTPTFDDRLIGILSSSTDVYVPNAQLPVTDETQGQFALAFTGGYRGRFALPAGTVSTDGARDGLYVAANFNYLRGLHYEDEMFRLRLDTNAAGLLTFSPLAPSPLRLDRATSSSGNGFAIDVGVGVIANHWAFGAGINGIANRIDWTDVTTTPYTLPNLFIGSGDFVEGTTTSLGTVRVELPVDYRGNVAYNEDSWTVMAEVGHGFMGNSFHAGVEERLGAIELRGGVRYTFQEWNPSGGVGFNLSRKIGIDVAALGTSANIERKRQLAIAMSLRIMLARD
ncbi:MAG TPA: hypothetical protein VI258_14475 [Rhodanobacteraceae bacterium]